MAIDLAVASGGPTFRRLRRQLPSHGIAVHEIDVAGYVAPIGSVADELAVSPDVGYVFPSRTVEGAVLDAEIDVPWVNDRAAIRTTRNKAGALAKLASAGLPIPETVHVSNPADGEAVRAAFRRFDGPAVVKPNTTTRGVGHVRVDDEDSLRGVVDYLDLIHAFPATEDRSYLLQPYLPDARDCRLTVIDGRVAGAVERRRSDGWVANVHRGAEAVGIDPPRPLVELAEAAADTLDIALLGVDLLVTDAGPVILEVNGRPTIDQIDRYPADFYDRLAALIKRTANGGD